jgi:feruloyl esterase
VNSAINITLGAGAISAVFTTPPTPAADYGADLTAFLLDFNFDTDAAKIFATSRVYSESAWDFMMASSTDLSAFNNRGSKLIVIHGVSDPIFSINDTINWWNEVNRINGGKAADFVRLFAIPGMAHCGGGPATDQFDALSALVNWVENGLAPDQILATAGNNTAWPNRIRPLCPYPKQTRYKGTGSIEDANNFVCK